MALFFVSGLQKIRERSSTGAAPASRKLPRLVIEKAAMSSDHFIFVGFERTEPVEALLEACDERDRVYLDDPTYLENLQVAGRRFLGKRIKDGAAIDRIEDTARSVVSLLTRVNGDWSHGAAAATVLALEDNGEAASDTNETENEAFNYADLVD
jgi:hypothetical protein